MFTESSLFNAARYGTRRCLLILGENETEVVNAAGGLIYDFSSTGWDVVVHMAAPGNDRPMHILGATSAPLSSLAKLETGAQWPAAVVVSPIAFRQDIAVRHYFTQALFRTDAAAAMWGDDWPPRLSTDVGRLTHHLSPAARAFKFQAKLAVEPTPDPSECAEIFRGSLQKRASHPLGATPRHRPKALKT